MAWWHLIEEFLNKAVFKKIHGGVEVAETVALKKEAIDWLYFWLGSFTNIYLFTLTAFFFTHAAGEWKILSGLLDALQEPYLGAVGIYVVLKEIRKRRYGDLSRHHGEIFVFLWGFLLFIASIFVIFSSFYEFDEIYKLIITNSIATLLIYIASLLNKP